MITMKESIINTLVGWIISTAILFVVVIRSGDYDGNLIGTLVLVAIGVLVGGVMATVSYHQIKQWFRGVERKDEQTDQGGRQ